MGDWLTPLEIEKQMRVSRATVDRWLDDGSLPHFRNKGVRRVRRQDLNEFIALHFSRENLLAMATPEA